MALGEELRDQPVLLEQHHRVTGQLKPFGEDRLELFLVSMQDQVSQPVNGTKLINVAASDPESLIKSALLRAIKRFLQGLFELSGG